MSDSINSNSQFNTPILFIIFNRIDTAQITFNEIRKQKPKQLFIAADGARLNVPGEKEKIQEVRNITKQIDWECDLKLLYSDKNQGCAKGPKNAITWFFDHVEQGIILEDDCVPHSDFFLYCDEMLIKYRDENRVMVISGNNFQDGKKYGSNSYYFSSHSNTWGWASWRRAWKDYDFYLDQYSLSDFKTSLNNYHKTWYEKQMWIDKFLCMKKRGYAAWDYQFSFHIWKNNGLCINPNVNLVSNIGFGEDATHTSEKSSLNIKTAPIYPIVHPKKIEAINKIADYYYYKKYLHKNIIQLAWRYVKRQFFIKKKFERD